MPITSSIGGASSAPSVWKQSSTPRPASARRSSDQVSSAVLIAAAA